MAGKVFTSEQKKILNKNPYVESVENTRIIYTEEFKVYYIQNYLQGKKPTEIFVSAGFDPSILGNKRIERASARWRKLYADGTLKIDVAEKNKETEQTQPNEQPVKKRRGRPRKNPIIVETSILKEEPKKKRGRPRKNPISETIDTNDTTKKAEKTKSTKKRTNKIALMAQNMASSKKEKTELPTETKNINTAKESELVTKKRRGRPRKTPLPIDNIPATLEQPIVIPVPITKNENNLIPQKKRRGRPRKNSITPVNIIPVKTEKTSTVAKSTKATNETKPVTAISITNIKPQNNNSEDIVISLINSINKLVKEVNSLKRQIAKNKKVNY